MKTVTQEEFHSIQEFIRTVADRPTGQFKSPENKRVKRILKTVLKKQHQANFEKKSFFGGFPSATVEEGWTKIKRQKVLHPLLLSASAKKETDTLSVLLQNLPEHRFSLAAYFPVLQKLTLAVLGESLEESRSHKWKKPAFCVLDSLITRLLDWPLLAWSLRDVALFELLICVEDKNFHAIAATVFLTKDGKQNCFAGR